MRFLNTIDLKVVQWVKKNIIRPKKKSLVSGPSLASIFGGNKKNRGEYKYRGKITKMEINVQNVFYLVVYRLTIS